MRDLPDLTFRGALRLPGHYDRPVLDRLNSLFGGVIMSGGAVALGAPVAAPFVGLAAMWNFVDQKNEAFGLTRTRHIAAAYIVLAASALIQAFQEAVGREAFKSMKLAQPEIAGLMASIPGEQKIAADVFDSPRGRAYVRTWI